MIKLTFSVLGIFIVCIGVFYLVYFVVRLWTGCSSQDAVTRIQSLVSGRQPYRFENDPAFVGEVEEAVRAILGEEEFARLMALARTGLTPPLLNFQEHGGLPTVFVSIPVSDEGQELLTESVLVNLVTHYLHLSGYYAETITRWSTRPDIHMPMLLIGYARTEEEEKRLKAYLRRQRDQILATSAPVTDEEGGIDLRG